MGIIPHLLSKQSSDGIEVLLRQGHAFTHFPQQLCVLELIMQGKASGDALPFAQSRGDARTTERLCPRHGMIDRAKSLCGGLRFDDGVFIPDGEFVCDSI